MRGIRYVLGLLVVVGIIGCGNDDYTAQTENCLVTTDVTGETYTLCCQVKCAAEYDYDDYRERCTEETTCSASTGAPCPLRVVQDTRAPACVY